MTYPAGSLGTFMELYRDAVDDFIAWLATLSPEDLTAQAQFGEATVRIPDILSHVAGAGAAFARDARRAITGSDAKPAQKPPENLIERIRSIVPQMVAALEGGWHLSDPELAKMVIDTPWNQRFSLDQLLEHAIVHVLWHKRQGRRVIAKARPRAGSSAD